MTPVIRPTNISSAIQLIYQHHLRHPPTTAVTRPEISWLARERVLPCLLRPICESSCSVRWLCSAVEGECGLYLVVEHTILDPTKFEEYRTKVGPIIEKHGGRYLTKGGTHKLLEVSRRPPDRVAIIEFPNMEALNRWYTSPEYQPLIPLRQSAVDMSKETLFTLEGV